ncbi:MAG: hypothetical protein JOY99_07195, partial [Sphingomonadaceae bacterium]|nr:hypothetical protein [Sphingomonadaceae bacterium]
MSPVNQPMYQLTNQIVFTIGSLPIRTIDVLIGFGVLVLLLLLAIAIAVARSSRRGAELAMTQAMRADELEQRLREIMRLQSETSGRADAMA